MYVRKTGNRINQGDILEDVIYQTPKLLTETIEIERITLPYAIVLTQDCDLEQDHDSRDSKEQEDHDKFLQSILLCPAYIAERVRAGTHLENLKLTAERWNKCLWNQIISNQNKRFHFLKADEKVGIPNIVVDFKHYYTFPHGVCYAAYKEAYKTSLSNLFREDLSMRFAYYLSRIGLPVDKKKAN